MLRTRQISVLTQEELGASVVKGRQAGGDKQ